MEYDFRSLSDYDFEQLVCDLLSARERQQVESFRQGRDQGIDLRCTTAGGGSVVVQCKHYVKTPFSGLCAAMKKETVKIQRLRPQRYLLVTSQFLSPAQKDTLLNILFPFCQSPQDIWGGNELNSLLRQYPQVEQAHYKLWLTSSAVLDKLLHSEIYQHSAMMREEIQNKLQIYVQSKTAYDKAQEMLNKYNCCIISGIPGIGKTTLAEILTICYLDQGYQIVKVRSDIQEALKAYRPEQKQVFIYDDFLGSTGLEIKENKNEGKDLLTFLAFISGKKWKKFILTTREYILNQARQDSEDFARASFDYNKCTISLEDYTRSDRARILYNHLFFYEVPKQDVRDLLAEGRVIRLIDHPNYNPRLIETVITLWKHEKSGRAGGFYSFFLDTLNHPYQLWEHAFCRRISPAARDLLLLLCPSPKRTSLSDLQRRYEGYHQYKSHLQNQPIRTTDFYDALKEAEGTFMRTDSQYAAYHNPSVQDFIHGYIEKNDVEFRMLCETAVDFRFCIQLAQMDLNLCRTWPEQFTAALRRTSGQGGAKELSEQVRDLLRINRFLQMEEIRQLIRQRLEQFFDRLEAEGRELSRESWRNGLAPRDLEFFLSDLIVSEYGADPPERLFPVFLNYALACFGWGYIYWYDDFLFFPALYRIHPFSVETEEFQPVYDALEDYQNSTALDEIQSMDYAGECPSYRWDIESLEDFFHIDLSNIVAAVTDRMAELEREEEDDEESQSEDSPDGNTLENGEILNMFQTLLDP